MLAIKTPPLLLLNDMTAEEEEQTDLKLSQAVFFFFAASGMLLILYLFLDYLKDVFAVLILVSCVGCANIIIEDFILQGLKPSSSSILNH